MRLGTLFSHSSGKALNGSDKGGKSYQYITTSNLYWNRFELDNLRTMNFKDNELEKCTATKGDLLVCEGGDIGRAAIWNYDYDIRIQNHIHKLRAYYPLGTQFFYYVFFLYKHIGSIGGKGIGIKGLSSRALHQILLPIAPINEQYRIIERIDEIVPIVDKYTTSQKELNDLNEDIFDLLKKSILQEAIQGRLVKQCETDEPASELLKRIQQEKQKLVVEGKLKAKDVIHSIIFRDADNKYYKKIGEKVNDITEEMSFDIPESWAWCRIKDCCIRIFSGKSPKYSKTPTAHIIIGQQANQWEHIEMQYVKYGTEEYARHIDTFQYLLDGDVLLNTLGNGTLGRCSIFENVSKRVLTDGHLFIFRTIEKSLAKYILYYLTLNYTEINKNADGSTNQTFLNLKKVSNYLIPLPPLKEIERIVSKKEELYSKL